MAAKGLPTSGKGSVEIKKGRTLQHAVAPPRAEELPPLRWKE